MSEALIQVKPGTKPVLDPEFVPAALWNRSYSEAVRKSGRAEKIILAFERSSGTVSTYQTEIFPHSGEFAELNIKYVERLIKFFLWMRGGYKVTIAGAEKLAEEDRKSVV